MSENETSPVQPPAPEAPKPPEAAPSAGGPGGAAAATAAAKAAGQDALQAFKTLLSDPVGKLEEACRGLGDQRAMAAGIVFGVVFDLCVVIGGYLIFRRAASAMGFSDFGGSGGSSPGVGFKQILRLIVSGVVPLVGLALGCAICRKVFGGEGNIKRDLFAAGAALLPGAAFALIAGILAGAPVAVMIAGLFAGSFTVMMLFSANAEMNKLTRRAASLAVPVTLLVAAVLAYLVSKIF